MSIRAKPGMGLAAVAVKSSKAATEHYLDVSDGQAAAIVLSSLTAQKEHLSLSDHIEQHKKKEASEDTASSSSSSSSCSLIPKWSSCGARADCSYGIEEEEENTKRNEGTELLDLAYTSSEAYAQTRLSSRQAEVTTRADIRAAATKKPQEGTSSSRLSRWRPSFFGRRQKDEIKPPPPFPPRPKNAIQGKIAIIRSKAQTAKEQKRASAVSQQQSQQQQQQRRPTTGVKRFVQARVGLFARNIRIISSVLVRRNRPGNTAVPLKRLRVFGPLRRRHLYDVAEYPAIGANARNKGQKTKQKAIVQFV